MAASEKLEETYGSAEAGKADEPDRYGEWLSDDARIWRVYGQFAKEDDKDKIKRWNSGLTNLALFAALFSGITTAFIIESQHDLKPDFAELLYRVQTATAHGRAYVEEPFVVTAQARLVNCLWITSLGLSLSAALIAIMGQDWIEMYVDRPVCNTRQWAEIRTFRINGVHRWYMPGVIATAPVLLHASLFLFGIGLAVFMASDAITRNLCIALCATTAFLYAVTIFSPILWPSSPFRSPATILIRRWFCAVFRRNSTISIRPDRPTLRAAPKWLQDVCSQPLAAFSRLLDQYGPQVSNGWTDVSETPSPTLVGNSLSWLSSASSAPEVGQLVVLGLCDHTTGLKVCGHASSRIMTQKLRQHAETNLERLSLPDLSRYVFICGNAGQRFWRSDIKRCFKDAIAAENQIPQDFLLALVHLTNGFQGEPSWQSLLRVGFVHYDHLIIHPDQLERVCARIPVCNPITLSTIASIIDSVRSDTAAISCSPIPGNLIVLMYRWRHSLPPDLRPIEKTLRGMLSDEALVQKSTLTTLCSNTATDLDHRPIDGIIHSLIAFFVCRQGGDSADRVTLDLILSIARASSASDGNSPRPHTCLAAIFGDSDPEITTAAWHGRPEHDIEAALICIDPRERPDPPHVPLACSQDLRPMLARMLVRDICPPFQSPADTAGRTRLPRGDLLFQLVAFMTLDGAAPDDLFHPMLEQGGLVNLTRTIDQISTRSGRYGHSTQFWRILSAIARWIATRSDEIGRSEVFELFTLSPTPQGPNNAVWNLVDAIGIAFSPLRWPIDSPQDGDGSTASAESRALFSSARRFMFDLQRLRAVFPASPLWVDIARQVGRNKASFPVSDWPRWGEAVQAATGVDPTQLSMKEHPSQMSTALEGAQDSEPSADGGNRTGEPVDAEIVATPSTHPTPQIGRITGEEISEGGP